MTGGNEAIQPALNRSQQEQNMQQRLFDCVGRARGGVRDPRAEMNISQQRKASPIWVSLTLVTMAEDVEGRKVIRCVHISSTRRWRLLYLNSCTSWLVSFRAGTTVWTRWGFNQAGGGMATRNPIRSSHSSALGCINLQDRTALRWVYVPTSMCNQN